MPHDTEHALSFMDHHHKMYQCLPTNSINSIDSSFPDYLYSLDIGNRASGIIEDLSECACCERHQTYKPTVLMNPSDFPEAPKSEKSPFIAPWPPIPLVHEGCECRCRHFARHLCRAYCVWAVQGYILVDLILFIDLRIDISSTGQPKFEMDQVF